MIEKEMDLWDAPPDAWIGIPSNGVVKSDGCLAMGAGVARQARDRYRGLDYRAGWMVGNHGNKVFLFVIIPGRTDRRLFTFPTKAHWRDPSDLKIIQISAKSLSGYAKSYPEETFFLPRPGCGRGGLRWEDVRPVIDFLPDNVIIVHKGGG